MNSVKEHLKWMAGRYRRKEPFCHLRFNDGEAMVMGLVKGGEANCDGHQYFPDMGRAMKTVLMDAVEDKSGEVLIGTIAKTDPEHPTAKALAPYLALGNPLLTVGEFWCQEEKMEGWEELQDLFGQIRYEVRKEVIFICNRNNVNAAGCLGAEDVLIIPDKDAWLSRKQTMRSLLSHSSEGTFIWACGFPGKVWSWMIRTLMPETTHIDVGHTFDGVYGVKSREWMKRDSEMSRFYFNTFAPWVRNFE